MNDKTASGSGSANSSAEPLRIGVYICRCGGNISDVVDVERVAEVCRHLPGVVTSNVHTFMCSDPGQKNISEDIRNEKLNRVVVASCSPFLHELTFRGAVQRGGLNPYLYEHANIREQCSWSHKHDPQGATAKAIPLIAAAVGKLRYAEPLDQIRLPNQRQALVVGGGVAGMKAAADLAGRGIPVLLVEQSERLGGQVNRWNRVFPTEQPAAELLGALRKQVEGHPRIEILLRSRVTKISGFIGNFQVTVEGQIGPAGRRTEVAVTVGALVMATGFLPYAPRDGEYAYHQHPAVLTTPEFLELLRHAPDAATLQFQGRPVRSIAFIHCVGSRQVEGVQEPQADGKINNYCSRVCCTTVLQQALTVRQRFPETEVYDLHQDIRTYGRGHEDYYIQASQAGVIFFRYHGDEIPTVALRTDAPAGAPPLRLTFKDYLTWGEELTLEVDMVVLAVGMTAGTCQSLVEQLKLPCGEDRFLQEIHPKLRPVEISVNGVLLAGAVQGPMNIRETLAAAGAAAVKAAAILAKEQVELNPYVAQVDADLCEGTGQCVEQCEYDGALRLVQVVNGDGKARQRAEVNPGLCVGCGACVAVCPARAINLNGWRLDQYEAMVDGLVAEAPALVAATA